MNRRTGGLGGGLAARGAVPTRCLLIASAAGMLPGLVGCTRQLTIRQADYINTAVHWSRNPAERTGEPLEINIVCVHSEDLKHPCNQGLEPGKGITSAEWFALRPRVGDGLKEASTAGRFWLPESQIFVMSYDKVVYGRKVGNSLRGAATDGRSEFTIRYACGGFFHRSRVVYVFGKFVDEHGDVLAVPPAVVHAGSSATVEVGVDERQAAYGQYIAPAGTRGRSAGR